MTHGTETWALKVENLKSLKRTSGAYDGELDVWSVLLEKKASAELVKWLCLETWQVEMVWTSLV